jgi:radical SAM superfamily enzyme YgiQ (UPF0313 family)
MIVLNTIFRVSSCTFVYLRGSCFRNMHIALISPDHGIRHILDLKYVREVFLGSSASTCMPLVLPLLAALTPPDFEITLLDEQTDAIDFDASYDLVAITTLTPLATRAYQIADEFRKRGVWVVLGGLHITLFPEEAQQHADTICIGEAEGIWPEFLRDFVRKQAKPVYRAYQNLDLSQSVIPRWDLLRPRRYRFFSIQASRGCKYNCDFCTVRSMYGPTRYKPIANVIREVAEVKKHTLPRSDRFVLVDDNFFSDRDYAQALITALIPLKLHWECFAPINIAHDPELLTLLQQSGCDRLSIGLESISQASLASVHKGGVNKYNEYQESIGRIHSYGLPIVGLFILGFDGDDETIFERTFTFVQETNIDFPIFSMLTPGPGTKLYERMEQEGRMLHTHWEEYDGTHVCFQPKLMSPETLLAGYRWLYKQLYGYDAVFQRTEQLWQLGVIKHPRQQIGIQLLASLILLKESVRQQFNNRALLPFIQRTLKELWGKPGIDIVTLLLNLGLSEYVIQLPEPQRAF